MSHRLADRSYEEVAALRARAPVLLLPIGATEAHGPHLPLDTDCVLSRGVADEVARRLERGGIAALVLPDVAYTVTDCAGGFAGTMGVAPSTLEALLEDVVRAAARQSAAALVLVNSHLEPAHRAVLSRIAARTDLGTVVVFPDIVRRRAAARLGAEFASGACHAGSHETSLMLALDPDRVRSAEAAALPENPASLVEAFAQGKHRFEEAGGPRAYFGAPARASAAEGRTLLSELALLTCEELARALPGRVPSELLQGSVKEPRAGEGPRVRGGS